jgi:hypothetical protein
MYTQHLGLSRANPATGVEGASPHEIAAVSLHAGPARRALDREGASATMPAMAVRPANA